MVFPGMKMIKKSLNSRTTILIFLSLLAFGLRIVHRIVFYSVGYDPTRQISASGNYIRGSGISDCTVSATNLADITCQPQNWWSAGYPLLLSWLHHLTADFIVSDYILICLGFLILFLSAYFIFKAVVPSSGIISPFHLFLLFSAFSFAGYHQLSTTDLLSFAFLVGGSAASISIIRGNYYAPSILAGLLFFLSASIRYGFYPFLVTVPAALFLVFLLTHKKQLIYSIVIFAAPVLTGFCLLWIFFPDHVLSQDIESIRTGWHWKHLLEFTAFPVRGFFFLDPFLTRLEPYYWLEVVANLVLIIISFIFVLGFISYATIYLSRAYSKKIVTSETYIYLLGAITLIINIGFLAWLSVRLPLFPEPWVGGNLNVTFVSQIRLFIPAIFFLQVFLFSLPFKQGLSSKKLQKVVWFLAITPIVFAAAYWSWKYFDVFINKRLAGTYYAEHADNIRIGNYLRDNLSSENQPAILAFVNYGEGYGASRIISDVAKGHTGNRFDWDFSVNEKLNTLSPVTVFFILPKEISLPESNFILVNKASIVLELPESNLYRMELKP